MLFTKTNSNAKTDTGTGTNQPFLVFFFFPMWMDLHKRNTPGHLPPFLPIPLHGEEMSSLMDEQGPLIN